MIAWDPPGVGNSRPPEREQLYGPGLTARDAEMAAKLMDQLGYLKYSILGWSEGGRVALVMAARYPDRIKKAVIYGGQSYVSPACKEALKFLKDISIMNPRRKAKYEEVHGKGFQRAISKFIDFYVNNVSDICSSELKVTKSQSINLFIAC